MSIWIKKHWMAAVGGSLTIPGIWQAFKWGAGKVLELGEHFEFISNHLRDLPMIGRVPELPQWVGIPLLVLGLLLIWWDTRRRIKQSPGLENRDLSLVDETIKEDINPLQIICGAGYAFESKKARGLYMITHTFSVSVKNTSRSIFLSNCKLYLDIADLTGHTQRSYLLVDTFTLNSSEERWVPIISYDEPATVSQYAGDHINLHVPIIGGYYNIGRGWPWQIPIGEYVFALRAISKETGPCEVACKAWVDETKILHFRNA